jgi:hypothetical protein
MIKVLPKTTMLDKYYHIYPIMEWSLGDFGRKAVGRRKGSLAEQAEN